MGRLILLSVCLSLAACECASKACPSVLFPCLIGCIPDDGTCCPNGSFCPNGTVCVPSGSEFTCTASGQNAPCPAGQRHCGSACVASDAECCADGQCVPAREKPSGEGICPDNPGFILCGQCVGEGGGCQGICRYCEEGSFCGNGDICGAYQCKTAAGGSGTNAGCGGESGGGGSCSDSQHRMATCPDGTKKCCSVNQVCCRDSAGGGAIACQFQGFCE